LLPPDYLGLEQGLLPCRGESSQFRRACLASLVMDHARGRCASRPGRSAMKHAALAAASAMAWLRGSGWISLLRTSEPPLQAVEGPMAPFWRAPSSDDVRCPTLRPGQASFQLGSASCRNWLHSLGTCSLGVCLAAAALVLKNRCWAHAVWPPQLHSCG